MFKRGTETEAWSGLQSLKFHETGLAQMEKELGDSLVEFATDLSSLMSDKAPQGVTGDLASGFTAEPLETSDKELAVPIMNAVKYWRYVNFGTEPFNMKLIPITLSEDIQQEIGKRLVIRDGVILVPIVWEWAQKVVRIDNEAERYKFCWNVFWKIAKKGITAQHFVEKAVTEIQKTKYLYKCFKSHNVEVVPR